MGQFYVKDHIHKTMSWLLRSWPCLTNFLLFFFLRLTSAICPTIGKCWQFHTDTKHMNNMNSLLSLWQFKQKQLNIPLWCIIFSGQHLENVCHQRNRSTQCWKTEGAFFFCSAIWRKEHQNDMTNMAFVHMWIFHSLWPNPMPGLLSCLQVDVRLVVCPCLFTY